MTVQTIDEAPVRTPVAENPRIAAVKAALQVLTYSDMVGVAANLAVMLPSGTASSNIAAALSRYANT